MTKAVSNISSQAVITQIEQTFRYDFELRRELPAGLQPLETISRNFFWSWQPDGIALFRDLDAGLWEKCEQNPRALLKKIKGSRLWQKALDASYVDRVNAFAQKLQHYLAVDERSMKIAYFCAEYGIHNSLPNYSGGLGILAGDHLKSASDLNLPLISIGLLYRYGYFRQRIGHDGWQEETYTDVFGCELALTPVLDAGGEHIMVSVHIRGREVFARAWLANVGRISLYLLDTNVPQNVDVDRLITGHLYGGDTETRIVQEKVLGIGGVRLLRKLGIEPDVYHLNEGHAAFSTLELVYEHLQTFEDDDFAVAARAVRSKCVFTTHTPVAAGNDVFDPTLLTQCFSKEFLASLKLTENEFLALGRSDLTDDTEFFGMTPLALRMCRSANGVSHKHGEVSRALWQKMFPEAMSADTVPITSVTNGVHSPTWIAPAFQGLYTRHFGDGWNDLVRRPDEWATAIASLSDRDIWQTHVMLKNLLIAFVRERTRSKKTGDVDTIHEREETSTLLSSDALTIGFARRVAAYKRWDLLFTDLERLLRMVDNNDRPVQFVFAGKAHPQDKTAKTILQKLMSINHDSSWQNRAVFIEDYDQEVARYLVQGVDAWLNLPRRPMEASGTSGMKAAMNGVLNCSILDGWWVEGYNGTNGFVIGGLEVEASDEEADKADAEALYSVLENEIIPSYYSHDADGISGEWIARMRNALATITPQFSSDRMVTDYLTEIYKT
jgi:starch phosphorylase